MRTRILTLLSSVFLGLAASAAAETPHLVSDINSLPESVGSFPEILGVVQGAAFFRATEGTSGQEVWRTDGTDSGTWQVVDICPGACGSNPVPLLATPGGFFFIAGDEHQRPQLWITRGAPASTFQLTTDALSIGRNPRPVWDGRRNLLFFRLVGSRLLFTLRTVGEGPSALWVTNGTAGGTRKLASFPTTGLVLPPFPFGGRILFSAVDAAHGAELWSTDGTPAGTRLFKDFCPGPCSSQASPLLVDRNRLVITARTPGQGSELWTTDGTAAGTRILRDVCRGPCDAFPRMLGVRNGPALRCTRRRRRGRDLEH